MSERDAAICRGWPHAYDVASEELFGSAAGREPVALGLPPEPEIGPVALGSTDATAAIRSPVALGLADVAGREPVALGLPPEPEIGPVALGLEDAAAAIRSPEALGLVTAA